MVTALLVSLSGILLFDSGNDLLARLPNLSRLKRGNSGDPAVQSASAKASANQGKQVPLAGRSLFDRHVGYAAKFRRLYG
jgi:hypothetical protein